MELKSSKDFVDWIRSPALVDAVEHTMEASVDNIRILMVSQSGGTMMMRDVIHEQTLRIASTPLPQYRAPIHLLPVGRECIRRYPGL